MAEQKEETKLKLYSNKICPFGYRAWLAIEAKKIPYEFIRCDLREKQDFFKENYAKSLGADPKSDGKVPIICDNGKYLTESFIIARYVEAKYGTKYGSSLFPDDAMQRAGVELMIDWFNNSGWIKNHYTLLMECDPTKVDGLVTEFKKCWAAMNEKLSLYSDKGLFLPNGQLSMFEVLAYPFFERICTIQHYAKIDIMGEWMKEFPRVSSWYQTAKELEPIKTMAQGDQFFIDGYKTYRERGQKRYDDQLAAAKKKAEEENK